MLSFINGYLMRINMAKWQWLGISFLLASLVAGGVSAEGNEVTLELDFLEFLGEGKRMDGEYHDPLQMQDLVEKKVVDAGQQQEENDHE